MLFIVVIGKLLMLNILRRKIFLLFMLINIILKVNQIKLFILIQSFWELKYKKVLFEFIGLY